MKLTGKRILGILLIMLLTIGITGIALASTTSVVVKLDGVTKATYSSTQLEAFNSTAKHTYSSYDECHDKYKYYTAYGPELQQVLAATPDINLNSIASIEIKASDLTQTLSKSSLLDTTRYYYADPSGSPTDTVPAIIATRAASGKDVVLGSLSATDCLRDFYGQTNADDYTLLNFVKNVYEINLISN